MLKKIYNRLFLYSFTIGSILGTIIFISIFGVSILNPKNIDWYINLSGDPGQQIIGWLAYLRSDYFFPVGLTDFLLYPDKFSIMYTDSMPLFSFLLKPIYYIIGDFQYFGLYGLFNFVMQIIFSVLIIRKFSNSVIIHIFGSLFIVFCPVFLFRIFGHHSLSSQWLILAVFAYILYNYQEYNLKKDIIFFGIISFIASGIHFYFFPMIFGLCIMYIIYKFIITKKFILCSVPISSFIITLFALYLYGAFYGIETSAGGGLGVYSFNLNGFLNSFGYSSILKDISSISGQYEGFAYIGVGSIILLIVSLCAVLNKNIQDNNDRINKTIYIFIVITFLFFIITSTGGYFYFGKMELFHVDLPQIFSTFRASGRFVWISVYILLFTILYFFSSYVNKKYYFIIIICFVIQFYDIIGLIYMKENGIKKSLEMKPIDLYSQEECKYFKDNFKYVHVDFGSSSYSDFYRDIYKFLKCDIPINNFYFARDPYELMKEKNAKLLYELYNKSLDNNTLILVYGKNMSFMMPYAYKMSVGNITLLSDKEINFLEKVEIEYYEVGEKVNNTEDKIFLLGWSGSEKTHRWSEGNESVIIIPINNNSKDVVLNLKLTPYLNKNLKEQSIKFIVNNRVLKEEEMKNKEYLYRIHIPKDDIKDNVLRLKIQLKNPVSSPSEVGGGDRRRLGVALTEMFFEFK